MPDWQSHTSRQRGILAGLIARYEQHRDEDTLPRGPRGIFYDLRPSGMGNGVTYRKPDSMHPVKSFGPMQAHPAAVQEVLVCARRAGIIPESWVADGRAPDVIAPHVDDDDAEEVAAGAVGHLDTCDGRTVRPPALPADLPRGVVRGRGPDAAARARSGPRPGRS